MWGISNPKASTSSPIAVDKDDMEYNPRKTIHKLHHHLMIISQDKKSEKVKINPLLIPDALSYQSDSVNIAT